tara:strand:+ start:1837 stop:2445 length:609 start_codon:yes stop_codon:yes gene_type:complete
VLFFEKSCLGAMENTNKRCSWCIGDTLYENYHDREWGVPIYDDHQLFEFLTLESFQAGLSWITILRKRENFRVAFDLFDFEKIAQYDDKKIISLLNDDGVIRNQQKIKAAVNNALRFIEVRRKYGSFSKYIWNFVGGIPQQNGFIKIEEIPVKTPLSLLISKDLKQNGFQFVGPTMVYAYMQAAGMVNDHLISCPRYNELLE